MSNLIKMTETAPLQDIPTVAIIVINWNGWRHTLECLQSLRQVHYPKWHLFIVDNASTDDSVKHLTNLGDDVSLIQSPVNGGWTGGNNTGIRTAMERGFDLFFILNNDAQVTPKTLTILVNHFITHIDEMPILGPVHKDSPDGDYNFIGAYVDKNYGTPTVIPVSSKSHNEISTIQETSFINGAAVLVHRKHFEKIGLYDDRYYLNFDETDWSFRAKKSDFKSFILRESVIFHEGSASIGGSLSPLNLYFMSRNRLLFVENHSNFRQKLRAFAGHFRWLYTLTEASDPTITRLCQMVAGKAPALVAFRAGIRDYLLRRFGNCPDSIRRLSAKKA
jgi:GT2 family glycosyltransferase